MKRIVVVLWELILLCSFANGQKTVDITEKTIRINKMSEEIFLYGFAAGDQLILSFSVEKSGSMKEVEVLEMPSSIRFMDYKVEKIDKKAIQVPQTGIYRFRFNNSTHSSKLCKINIQRIPSGAATQHFNTSVYWHTVQDTSYLMPENQTIMRKDTSAHTLLDRVLRISASNLINSQGNKTLVDFTLPKGTVSWSYYIGVGTEGQKAYAKAKSGFLNSAAATAAHFMGYGTMAALALYGFNAFSLIQGEDNVKISFINNETDANLFRTGKVFKTFKEGNVLNDAAQMRTPLAGKIYLGLLNDNLIESIEVMVSVTAVVVTEHSNASKIMKINTRQESYLKN